MEYGTYRFFTPNYCPAYRAYTEYAFEITQTNVASENMAGFAELRFYDCLGMQLLPSTWSNPGGDNIASYHYPSAAFDGDTATNWLDRNKQPLIAIFSTAVRVASYKWIAASDASMYPGRNPASWKLKARAVSSDAWSVLATVVLHSFTAVNNELVGPFSLSAGDEDVAGEAHIIRIADLHGMSPKCSIYNSSSGFLLLKFASDGSVNGDGFTAAWSIGGKGMMFS